MRWTRRDVLELAASACCLAVVAVALRYPTSLSPYLLPADTNSELHVLLGAALADGEFGHVAGLAYPAGLDVRVVALPMLLLALPLQPLLGQVAAFNVAVVLWLVLNGAVVQWVGVRLGLSRWGALALAVVSLLSSQCVGFLGNGQFENVVPAALALGVLAGHTEQARRAAALVVVALLLAGFSSPYQAVVVVLLCLGTSIVERGPLRAALLLGVSLGALLPVGWYYATATVGLETPAPVVTESLNFLAPSLRQPGGGELSEGFPYMGTGTQTPPALRSIGWVLPIGGLLALGALRRRGLALGVAGLLVFLVAIGPELRLGPVAVPGPYALAGLLPGLRDMGVTFRFGTGLVFVAGLLILRARPTLSVTIALPALVGLETLLFSSATWPSSAGVANSVAIDGPVGFWPAPPIAPSFPSAWVAMAYDVPVAWGPEEGVSAWIYSLRQLGVEKVVVHHGDIGTPEPLTDCLVLVEELGAAASVYALSCSGAPSTTPSGDAPPTVDRPTADAVVPGIPSDWGPDVAAGVDTWIYSLRQRGIDQVVAGDDVPLPKELVDCVVPLGEFGESGQRYSLSCAGAPPGSSTPEAAESLSAAED
ncbi:MAG TPA: hypothetical protein QGF58_22725 [Myxococcota bacterium]|nr:hypothetical protein [Myxococcota bacterium]